MLGQVFMDDGSCPWPRIIALAHTNVTEKLLTVSSCKNLKKYFAIKSIISLFRAAMQQATTSLSSSFLISRNFVAGIISVIIISITGITG
jgi:hypothetical protein